MKRTMVLVALVIAVVLVLSAPMVEAKKHHKKHHRGPPAFNVVQCPTESGGFTCNGTASNDYLVGGPEDRQFGAFDEILGGEGNDVYDGKGGCDAWEDASHTSSDRYLISVEDFCNVGISFLSIQDGGGSLDVLDLSRFYKSTDFSYFKGYTNLHLDGPGLNDIDVLNFYEPNGEDLLVDSIDFFKFSDGTLTAEQINERRL